MKLSIVALFVILIPCSLNSQTLDLIRVQGPTLQLGPDSGVTAFVPCPSGYKVVSGGYETQDYPLDIARSLPTSNLNDWEFRIGNPDSILTITVNTYCICVRLDTTTTSVSNNGSGLPKEFNLGQNYPNPFNPLTSFQFSIDKRSDVRVEIFDEIGRLITILVEGTMEAGRYDVTWNGTSALGSSVSSGSYYYRLTSDGEVQTKKMILIK